MKIKSVGEFGLIDILKEDTIYHPANVVVGIGDDAAVLLPTPRHLQLMTTDMLVENVHFTMKTTLPQQLGYKSMAVSFSDIAAMGGKPCHAVVSIAIPPETDVDFMINLYQGMKEICREYAVNIVGGDTVSTHHELVINVTVTGEVDAAQLVRRAGAQVGDIVAVTGTLGNSSMGLALLSKGQWEDYPFAWPLVTAHLTPKPLVGPGQRLGKMGATSMNDISDGLASEMNEIASASKVGVRLEQTKLPLSKELLEATERIDLSALDCALYGGEDYQLVFTMNPADFSCLTEESVGCAFTAIGEVVEGEEVILLDKEGQSSVLKPRGFNHFC
ncbi:thiamine-monophosphate kinase [Sporomusaceae bacterium BoRhaA]|uniref:thiamine-phosphate kinase n=1 Tax=Pelorhabdus rhamnosifermentans TaxID=2772457 RepID=UPI001C061479|nr:thiamine-phosphate kinase [Pelorhabdus rhamnosifermentans]MBU2702923.1 thiamine-monophosphate kinase [Pelorhabdus rhamnosifermentans]